jgi:site-specific DNA recombinase
MKAALYARYSTDKQSEASIDDQFRVCERLAETEQFVVTARFSDAAVSGGTSTRPGYQRLLAAARRHEFDVIVAEDSSRLWREMSEQWRAIKELQDLGIHVVGHSLDTRRPENKILLSVNGAMAEAYRDEIARRVHRGLEGLARAGKPTGGKAYGYVAARDSGTGCIEVNETEAAIIRRIFEMYANGTSPRTIAATLNSEGIPSPGASWNRTVRRNAGWLASAIHGDVNRGTGILNNRRYAGVVVWGRSRWQRGASDSSKRKSKTLAKPLHEARDERLRIVPAELWERVKARQASQRQTIGANVCGALRRRAVGAGRPAKHVLSGLLRCGVCNASFALSNATSYTCASFTNGNACTNSIRVSRVLVEKRVVAKLKADLLDPSLLAEIEKDVNGLLNAPVKTPSPAARIAELHREIENLANAVASGLLKSSPALGKRLAAAERELESIQFTRSPVQPRIGRIVPRVADYCREAVEQLEQTLTEDPERAKLELRSLIVERFSLIPDESGKFLWAEWGLESAPLHAAMGGAEIMVAGGRFQSKRPRVSLQNRTK